MSFKNCVIHYGASFLDNNWLAIDKRKRIGRATAEKNNTDAVRRMHEEKQTRYTSTYYVT